MTKYNIVQIGEEYAFKKTILGIFVSYKDLVSTPWWWGREDRYFHHCLGTLEQVQKKYEMIAMKEVIIK